MQPIEKNEEIWKPAKVTKQRSPRSYIVTTEDGKEFRRHRQFLKRTPSTPPTSTTKKKENSDEETELECSQDGKNELTTAVQTPKERNSRKMERPRDLPEENLIYSRAGRLMKKPKRYQDN